MHLAIDAFQLAIGANDGRRVVVEPRATALEKRRDDYDSEFASELPERFGGRTRNRLGQSKQLGILFPAEILRAEEFLKADDLRSPRGCLARLPGSLFPDSRWGPARRSSAPDLRETCSRF